MYALYQVAEELGAWHTLMSLPEDFSDRIGLFDILNKSYDLTQDRLTEIMFQVHKPDLVINLSRDACGVFEFYRANEIIEDGRLAFHHALNHYRLHSATT